jgi:hypothetical protein
MRAAFLALACLWLACEASPRPPVRFGPGLWVAAGRAPDSAPAAPAEPAIDPSWPRQLYVISDSVLLGARAPLKKSFEGWKVTIQGRGSLFPGDAVTIVKRNASLPPVALVALGYNTIWGYKRKNYDKYAEEFDKHAEALLAALAERGVKKIAWVLLREPTETKSGKKLRYEKVGWHFVYVNERLAALKERHPEITLVDWRGESATQHSYTADGIHLTHAGAAAMVELIGRSLGL